MDKLREHAHFLLIVCAMLASSIVYAYSTFATINYVHDYVDSKHQQVIERLDDSRVVQMRTWDSIKELRMSQIKIYKEIYKKK